MGNIIILDELTANKIAAGEVIERPASVVKETVENSIDAGAKNISVEIKNGGITYIRVSDDGHGIAEDDCLMAFERHGTSKIKSIEDINEIRTMGFRGEALASISAVSSVELITKTQDEEVGNYVRIRGGSVEEVKKTGCPTGTTLLISELFFNTPARFKFLKKDSTEAGHVATAISRLALGYPNISFKYINNGTLSLHTPGNGDVLSAIYSIYGKDTANETIKVDYADGKIKVYGYTGMPNSARNNRNYQLFFINGRYIKSKIVSSAIDEAYKTLLMKNKHAFCVLHIEINPLLVDVNVHPQKLEVRFSNEQDIFRAVYYSISNAINGRSYMKSVYFNSENKQDKSLFQEFNKYENTYKNTTLNINKDKVVEEINKTDNGWVRTSGSETKVKEQIRIEDISKIKLSDKQADFENEIKDYEDGNRLKSKKDLDPVEILGKDKEYDEKNKYNNNYKTKEIKNIEVSNVQIDETNVNEVKEAIEIYKVRADDNEEYIKYAKEMLKEEENIGDKNKTNCENNFSLDYETGLFDGMRIIGQVFLTYIILEKSNDLYLIDQHAAHERIMFEKIKQAYEQKKPYSQVLLSPVVIDLTLQEIEFLEENKEIFARLGFLYEGFGKNSIIIREVPLEGRDDEIKDLLFDIVDRLMKSTVKEVSTISDEVIYGIACKSAIKANRKMSEFEINAVLKELAKTKNPYTCPHGRPIILKLGKSEIEKMFKRIL